MSGWEVLNADWPNGTGPHIVPVNDDTECVQCGAEGATDREWGPLLCDLCAGHTARGDGGDA